MDLNLNLLRTLLAVDEEQTLTGAARRLELTQPAVSYQIRQAEERLGVQLFQRRGRGVAPTRAGERLVCAARAVLREVGQAAQDIRRIAEGDEGLLRLSAECFTTYHWLPGVIRAFRAVNPRVDVEIDVDPARRVVEAVEAGNLEVALTTVPPAGDRLELTPLFDDEVVVVVPPGHRLAGRAHVVARDLADQAVLVYSERDSDVFNLVLRPAGVRPRRVTELGVTDTVVEMIRAGLGIGVMASWLVEPQLRDGSLCGVRVTRGGLKRRWLCVTRKAPRPPFVDDFVDALRASVPRRPGGARRRAGRRKPSGRRR